VTEDTLRERVASLHEHLRATESMPIDPGANRWLGEATAVAAAVDEPGVAPETVHERVERVAELLAEVEDPDHERAAEAVAAAREVATEILAER